jgi:DNA-binding MarR family transcriptional regulator
LTVNRIPADAIGPPLIGALLRIPHEVVRERMLEGLHARGFTDLHPAHLIVFQYPGPQGARPLDLARRTRMSKQAMNHLLGQLERLGYLVRDPDSADQRQKRVRVTPRGTAVLLAMREIVAEVETEWERILGPRRFVQLRAMLAELADSASREAQSPSGSDGNTSLASAVRIPSTRR